MPTVSACVGARVQSLLHINHVFEERYFDMRRPIDLIERIVDDLRSQKLRFPASEHILLRDYARAGQLPWQEYRIAARIAGEVDGTLVVVDDVNERIVGETNFDGEYDPASAHRFASQTSKLYALENRMVNRVSQIRFSLYRLPRGSYSSMPHSFFFEHGDLLGGLSIERPGRPCDPNTNLDGQTGASRRL